MGGLPISDGSGGSYDLARLERAVKTLAERHRVLRAENAELREKLAERETRVRSLDGQIREINQRRQDASKRLDDLIAQVEQLDASFGATAQD